MVLGYGYILKAVMNMNDSKQILADLLRTTQIGQVGIRSVLDTAMRPSLRKALESQLKEYDNIESEAHAIASQRGWELEELEPGVRFLTDMATRIRLGYGSTDSKIAGMMIQSNTRGMITGLKNAHQYTQPDLAISTLSQRLLDCETAIIRQMQTFL